MPPLLPLIWILIIAFCIIMYVILDGFTLGTGILMPTLNEQQRGIAVSVLLPTWDGNQTWLVLGSASLYGAFPSAFSSLLPALYLPLLLMVVCLLLRGVVFEFRLKAKEGRKVWDTIFFLASLLVTLIQGAILGNFVQGFVFTSHPYIISDENFLTPFTLFTAVSLVFGYALLGSTRLIIKTDGELQAKMYQYAKWLAVLIMIGMVVASVWTPFMNDKVFQRWFAGYNWIYLAILPYITVIAFGILMLALYRRRNEALPFFCSVILFLCLYAGFAISLYPYLIPYQVTFWDAASPNGSLLFMLVGAVIMLPVLVIYTAYSYHIFKGKVKDVIEY